MSRYHYLLFSVYLLLVAACGRSTSSPSASDMNTIPLRTLCVGNLVVDLPAKPKTSWTQHIDGAAVSRIEGVISREQFWTHVERRRSQLQALPHATEETQLSFYERFGERAAVALYRASDVWTGGYAMERFLWLDTRGYVFISPVADNNIKQQITPHLGVFDDIAEHDGRLSEPGFCFDGARFTGSQEDIEVYASQEDLALAGLLNGALSVSSSRSELPWPSTAEKPITPFESLQQEQDAIRQSAVKFPSSVDEPDFTKSFEVLRKRVRNVGGSAGQEVAFKEVLNSGKSRYQLEWASTTPAEVTPRAITGLTLKIGNEDDPADPALKESVVFSLWDAVLDSVKSR